MSLSSCLSPGDALLLRLLRCDESPLAVDDITPDTWNALLTKATELTVSPLIYAALRLHAGRRGVPDAVYHALHNHYAESGLRNLALYQRLRTVLQQLQQAGIAVIVLKGAYLAQTVYHDPALRLMSDVDLLVKAEQLAAVQDCFHGLGYTQVEFTGPLRDTLHHDQFSHPTHSPDFELHWTLVRAGDPFRVDHDGLWGRAVPVALAGVPVQTLAPEDALLHLCIHTSFQHIFDRFALRCLCDIQRYLIHHRQRLDWEQVCRRAVEWGCVRNVHLTLLLAQELLAAPVPPAVSATLRPPAFDPRLPAWAAHRILGMVDDRSSSRSANLGQWHLAETLSDKAAVAARVCFPPRQVLTRRYQPEAENVHPVLLYVRHWGHLVVRGVRGLMAPDGEATHRVGRREREMGRIALEQWLHYEK